MFTLSGKAICVTFPRDAVDLHFDVDVRRPTLIPAGVDRREGDFTVAVRRLDAAQKRLSGLRTVFRVVAGGIDVPDLDVGVGHAGAVAVDVHHLDGQREDRPRLPFTDVASKQTGQRRKGAGCFSRRHRARGIRAGQRGAVVVVVLGLVGESLQPNAIAAPAAPITPIASRRPIRLFRMRPSLQM